LTKGHQAGDVLARLDFDPYFRSFRNSTTHILATEQSESAIRLALREGRAYVAHDWMCDPTGFTWTLVSGDERDRKQVATMGDEIEFAPGGKLVAEFPVPCRIRLFQSGSVIVDQDGDRLEFCPEVPGVYRVEGWLTLDGEERPWVYSNPIYLR
jgi:hypothetical protein